MNQREVSEIRRLFRPDKFNAGNVYGCYVSNKGEILTEFSQSLHLMHEDEREKVLSILKKTLSGTIGRNLLDIVFPTKQVLEGEEHKLLMSLRDTRLQDQEPVHSLYKKIIQSISMETNYLILLICNEYDVPYRGKDGSLSPDQADQIYRYVLCSICPVGLNKSFLSFSAQEHAFHNSKTEWLVGSPELGFLFPAFDGRSTNLYGALSYTRNVADNHEAFIHTVFGVHAPEAAAQQQENFRSILCGTLEDDCSMEVIQSVHNQFQNMIQSHKENREKDPLVISGPEINHMLLASGLTQEKVRAFGEAFDKTFGSQSDIIPSNLLDPRHFRVDTPDVKVQVAPDKQSLIETRVLGGVKYLLIRAEDGVEVNGVPINIS